MNLPERAQGEPSEGSIASITPSCDQAEARRSATDLPRMDGLMVAGICHEQAARGHIYGPGSEAAFLKLHGMTEVRVFITSLLP